MKLHVERPKNPPDLMMINGCRIVKGEKETKKVFFTKDGIMHLVVDNGLT